MSLPHYGAWKLATWILSGLAAVIVAMDPTMKVAIVTAIPATLTLLFTILTWFMGRKSLVNQSQMKESIDGHFTKLMEEKTQQGVELVEKTDKLSHAEGRREGIESTESKK
jgi:membrane protein implicated in regulation of membrane protease activity